ncbi:MAG: carbohydrate-binding protein [Dysgonamonadaceae bacterium]|jgi:hypothetical protein|nr:carbohydrate-binding protein [Dysgonamonadaceae bacterium]
MKSKRILLVCVALLGIAWIQAQTRNPKRGLGYGFPMKEDIEVLAPAMAWTYNWGTNNASFASTFKANNIDVVPMAWNGTDAQAIRNFKNTYPNCQYILAFNEPNLTDQANMTPAQAAAKWPELKAIANELGLKIISPAMNYGTLAGYSDPIKWLDEFFAQSGVSVNDVDGISIHCYMSSVGALKSYVEKFRKYNKPVWLTEFCAWEGNVTVESQQNYLVEAFNYLETEPLVARYAWFIGRGWNDAAPYMQLLDRSKEGVLKDLGQIYVHLSSHDVAYWHKIDQIIQAEHYIRSSAYIHAEKTSDTSGDISLSDFYIDSWAEYQVDVAKTGDYYLYFRVAAAYDGGLKVTVDGNQVATLDVPATGGLSSWKQIGIKARLNAGKQTLRVAVTKGRVNFNWWIIRQFGLSIQNLETETLSVYPNPVIDQLYLKDGEASVTVYDLSGKKLLEKQNASSVDLSALKAGVYLVEVQAASGERNTYKIIKK